MRPLPSRERASPQFNTTDWVRGESRTPHPTVFVEHSALPSPARGEGTITSAEFSDAVALTLIAAQVGLVVLGAAGIVGLAMQAAPGAHQIVEHVGVEVLSVAALVLGVEVLAFGDEFRPARPLGHELDPAGALELERDPNRLLDAAPGRDDAVVAQDERTVLAEAPRHRLAALLGHDEIRRLGENRQLL